MQQTSGIQNTNKASIDAIDPAQLATAFEQFGRLSEKLQQSYENLDHRAAELSDKLDSAQRIRIEQLAEKEQLAHRLEALLDALPAGVLWVNADGIIQTANPAAELFLEQNLSGKAWQRVYAHSIARHTEQELFLNSGRVLKLKTQPLENHQGEIILLDDISEQHMLQSLAHRQSRLAAMGQMAAGLAHQLRTPMSSAVLYASQLNTFTENNPAQNKAVDKIRTSLRYLEKLINDMLMYAKGGEFSEQGFPLDDLLVSFNTRIENQLREHKAQLTIISQLNDIQITGSLDALVSVLLNLAENAIQACQQIAADHVCQLELEVYKQSDYLILALRDNGPGLSVEQQSKIFQPFYTLREGGTGLGLSVAHSIVQAHQGDLVVRSQPGNGASFYICLPLNQGEQFLGSGQTTAGLDLNDKSDS